MPPASGTPPSRSCRSRVSAAVTTAGIHSPAGSNAVRQARAVCSAVGRLTEPRGILRTGAVAPPGLPGIGQEHHRAHHAVGERVGVAVGVVGLRPQQAAGVGLVAHERNRGIVAAKRRAGQRQSAGGVAERFQDRVAPALGVAAVVDLVEDDQRAFALGAHPVTGRMAGDLGVGDDDAVVLRRRVRGGVAELRVQRDAVGGRRLGPLHLEMFGGHHHGDRLDGAVGQQLAGDAQSKCGLTRTGSGDQQKITRLGGQIAHQSSPLPAPQSPGAGRFNCPHPETPI